MQTKIFSGLPGVLPRVLESSNVRLTYFFVSVEGNVANSVCTVAPVERSSHLGSPKVVQPPIKFEKLSACWLLPFSSAKAENIAAEF